MLRELIPLALSNPGLLSAVLLAACRSLFKQDQNNYYVELATFYKLVCLQSMSQRLALENRQVGDPEIAQAALLAADEVSYMSAYIVVEKRLKIFSGSSILGTEIPRGNTWMLLNAWLT